MQIMHFRNIYEIKHILLHVIKPGFFAMCISILTYLFI